MIAHNIQIKRQVTLKHSTIEHQNAQTPSVNNRYQVNQLKLEAIMDKYLCFKNCRKKYNIKMKLLNK